MATPGPPTENKEGTSTILEPKLSSPRDVIFVLDSSGSLSDEDFDRALMFTRRIVGLLDISQTHTRVAMVNYGTKVKVEFSLHHYNQEKEIQKAIANVDPLGGSTKTSEALEKVIKICEHRHNTRNPLIVILITDGHSDNRARAIQIANTLRQEWGAHFFAVGVGSAVNQTELSNLASSKENVLLVDSYRALKNVREKVAVKACSVVRRPRLHENVTTLGPTRKIVFVGSYFKANEDRAATDNRTMIDYIRSLDKCAARTEIVYLTFDEDSEISANDRESAKSENITLVGCQRPVGCPEQLNTSELDIYATAFFQNVLHSPLINDVTHIIGHSSATINAMHNIADAIEEKNQMSPRRILVCSIENYNASHKKCLQLADVILCTSGVGAAKSLLNPDLLPSPEIFPFNIAVPFGTSDQGSKEDENRKVQQEAMDYAGERPATEEGISNPQLIFLGAILGGIKFEISLTTREGVSEETIGKLQKAKNVVAAILDARNCFNVTDMTGLASHLKVPQEIIETWLNFFTETETPDRKILKVKENGKFGLSFTIFCVSEDSVKKLWTSLQKDKPTASTLNLALKTSQVPFQTCKISLKSEVKEELIGSIVMTSEEYMKEVAIIITRRRKEQDRKWMAVHGSEKDKKIAKEIESRRLEKKWETILEEARSMMGEKGVEALEKAREQYDNDVEFIARIEESMEAGSFMAFLKDLIANLCRVM